MVFSSMSFLFFFLPALLVLYYIVPRRFREARNFVLLAFSLFFYGYGGPKFLLLMVASIIINYVCGLFAGEGHGRKTRRFAVAAASVLGLGLLGWFKYAGFFAGIINSIGFLLPVPEITLPIGISFFTFQGLSYVYDVYRGDAGSQKNPLRVALYVALFPQLVAGPIVRYTTVAEAICDRRENLDDFSAGAVRFVFGLAKKMVIANSVGQVADSVFALSSGGMSVATAWIGAVSYTLQIYFDFSAYSDMAIGLGRMFGFTFLENFNYPYISKSITEFWRRWHISLSTWFRDYVYIPLGGNRCAKWKHIRNIVVVWLLTGLWHGASWNFVVWGLWFCAFLLLEKFVWGRALERAPSFVGHIYTMLVVVLSWVLFRAENLTYAVDFAGAMFGNAGLGLADGQAWYFIEQNWTVFVIAAVAALPVKSLVSSWLEKRKGALSQVILIWWTKAAALALLALCYMYLVTGSFNPFIYFRF